MKYYDLAIVSNFQDVSIKKKFRTRSKAIDYALKYLSNEGSRNIQLEDIIERSNKHNLEYICSDRYSRFFINRHIA